MLNQMIRGQWDRIMRPIGRALGRTGVSPDTVTLLGVLIQVGAAWLILDGRLLLAGLVSIAAGISDVLDGAIAKAQGRTGKFGALLDSTTDRLADALFFLPIAWLYSVSPDTPSHDVPWVAVVALVALVEKLRADRFVLLDTQWLTPHLQRFGAVQVSRREYMHVLTRAVALPRKFTD